MMYFSTGLRPLRPLDELPFPERFGDVKQWQIPYKK